MSVLDDTLDYLPAVPESIDPRTPTEDVVGYASYVTLLLITVCSVLIVFLAGLASIWYVLTGNPLTALAYVMLVALGGVFVVSSNWVVFVYWST